MAKIWKRHSADCTRGKCECRWVLDYRPLGVRGPRQRLRFETHKEAERFLISTQHKVAVGDYVDPAKVPTFEEAAEDWFRGKSHYRPAHIADIRGRLDKHLLPRFGTRRLDRITVADLDKLRDDLRSSGYAHTTINRLLQIAGAIFQLAINHGQATVDPTTRVERVRKAAREITLDDDGLENIPIPDRLLSPAEIARLLEAAAPGFERTLFLVAYLSGARQGELFALRWSDLELPKEGPGTIFIRRSLSWAHLRGEEPRPRYYAPKTEAGLRRITIPAELVAALKRWKLQSPPSPEQLVFPRPDGSGKPLYREFVLRKMLYPALERARLRRVRFHSLRHSCASALIAAGASVTEVQHQLGHASPAITLAVYSHWFQDATGSGAIDRITLAVADMASGTQRKWAQSGHFGPNEQVESGAAT
ncbi:MAG TPA: site-specific integrase [Candidatus Binataceae bacterium]|nr:site-specific integrase [Candidatus Binataceae bacterium]